VLDRATKEESVVQGTRSANQFKITRARAAYSLRASEHA
jgi:hypothetical protein